MYPSSITKLLLIYGRLGHKLVKLQLLSCLTHSCLKSTVLYFYRPHPKDGEGTVFSLFVSPHLNWGGRVTSSQVWIGGVPHPRSRQVVPHPRSRWGVPHPRSGQGGTPLARTGDWMWYPPGKDWMGYPPQGPGMGYPPTRTGWGTPWQGLDVVPSWPRLDGVPLTWTWDGVPPLARTGWGTPSQNWMGYPPLIQDWMGYPPIRQSSIASTCYTAGGIPLAFTQEDFLVHV